MVLLGIPCFARTGSVCPVPSLCLWPHTWLGFLLWLKSKSNQLQVTANFYPLFLVKQREQVDGGGRVSVQED